MAESELLRTLGEPTDTGGYSRKQRSPLVLRFGDLEFGIDPIPNRSISYISLNKLSKELDVAFQGSDTFFFSQEGILCGMPIDKFLKILEENRIDFMLIDEFDHQVIRTECGVKIYSREEFPQFDASKYEPQFLGKIINARS